MLETNLMVTLAVGGLLLVLPPLVLAIAIGIAFYRGWFTLPHPEPDRERVKTPPRPT